MRAILETSYWWASPSLAFVLTYLGLRGVLASPCLVALAIDVPNARSLHAAPTPRVGGLIMLTAILVSWVAFIPELRAIALTAAGLGGLSAFDDRRGLPIKLRFGAHVLAAMLACWLLANPEGVAFFVFATLATVWATNLNNFMDGSDGLAGGMAAIGFCFLGAAAFLAADHHLAALCWTISAAALAFLSYNWFPARTFMGDAGSIPLGFLASTVGVAGCVRGHWPAWYPAVVFAPFLADASYTLMRRLLRGERFWEAHRSHCYQVMVLSGWSHARLASVEYGLMVTSGVCGLVALQGSDWVRVGVLVLVILGAGGLIRGCEYVRHGLKGLE